MAKLRAYCTRGVWRCKPRLAPGKKGRPSLALAVPLGPEGEAQAQARAALLAELLEQLAAAGQDAKTRSGVARRLCALPASEVEGYAAFVREDICGLRFVRPDALPADLTVRQLGQQWVEGQLAARFPDQVRKRKYAHYDQQRLTDWVYPHIGPLLVREVRVVHLDAIRAGLVGLRSATRRNILTMVKQMFDLAVEPVRLIERSPVPSRGFLPRLVLPAFQFLRPAEDALLMACSAIAVHIRIFYGLMCRVGFRPAELLGLNWTEVDLEAGYMRLPEHKTDRLVGERLVPLAPGDVRALAWLRTQQPDAVRVIGPFRHENLLAYLRQAGVEREELFVSTETRHRLRPYDLRGSFVTIASGQGRSEGWIMERTGHVDSRTLARYRRLGRLAERFGDWTPLDLAVPEVAEALASADRGEGARCPRLPQNADKALARVSLAYPAA